MLIRDCLSAPVIASVMEGAADFGLTIKPEPMPKLSYRPLLTDDFCLVCRSDDPLANGGPVPWSVFREHPFVAMSPASSVRRMTDAAFLQAGLTVKQLFECAHLATTGNLVIAGLGITALPELTLPILGVAGLSVRRLIRPIITRRLGIVTRAGRPLRPPALHFYLSWTKERGQSHRASLRGPSQGQGQWQVRSAFRSLRQLGYGPTRLRTSVDRVSTR